MWLFHMNTQEEIMQRTKTQRLAGLALGLAVIMPLGAGQAAAEWTGQWQSRVYRSTSPDKQAYTSGRVFWKKAGGDLPYHWRVKGRLWSHTSNCASAYVYQKRSGEPASQGRLARKVCSKGKAGDYKQEGRSRQPVAVHVGACGPGGAEHCDDSR
jgi:hypothetical protein